MLYPLKFKPIFQEKLWGGKKLSRIFNKNSPNAGIGESWEISGLSENVSVVSEGFLKDNSLLDIQETYLSDFIGDTLYAKFGTNFPLLVKLIDADDDLSVQVHPDDDLAAERYGENGKNELWYIAHAEPGAELILGFNKKITKEEFLKLAKEEKLRDYLFRKKVKTGEAYYIPAGLVHSIGRGIVIAEIQQSSDITYRIDDRNRRDKDGNKRQLHIMEAADAIDFEGTKPQALEYDKQPDKQNRLFESAHFCVNFIPLRTFLEADYNRRESFTIYLCLSGSFKIVYPEGNVIVSKGETVLLPSEIGHVDLQPIHDADILEVYIDTKLS
jgi:mannose-6-phosphate isomerase